jgi:hypothetical protein
MKDEAVSTCLHELTQVRHESGFCWIAALPPDVPEGDYPEDPFRSTLRLFEDGREMGPGHTLHEEIRKNGSGRFSHWERSLYFSTSDNEPPRNRHRYLVLLDQPATSATSRVLLEASKLDVDAMSPSARYDWAERLFTVFVPGEPLGEAQRSCFRDEAFHSYYLKFQENHRSFDRKYALREFARLAATLPGEMAECGVYRGATAYLLAEACRAAGRSGAVHLFDSFAGISTPGEHDGSFWQLGDMAASIEVVRAGLGELVEWVTFHSGWIPERFPDVADRRFALVHIDLDLYQPTRDAVAFFYARLIDRGILVCDDYGFETCPGARRAMDEFFADKPLERIVHLPTGQGVVLRRKS